MGVCGGIAAYKAVELLRLLVKSGAEVHVVMTRSAREFVAPLTFQTLSGHPVHTELFNLIQEQEINHISLADRADLMLIVPATANLVGKVSNGLADDLLTTTIMATKAPVLFVPAMNVNMWTNPIYQENQAKLSAFGYHFMAPVRGELACGWEGEGKLPAPEAIFDYAQDLVGCGRLAGKSVVVTAGPTREELDPVRYLTNFSSGKMGFAIARAARNRGARVVLVSGPVNLIAPQKVEMIPVRSAAEMCETVLAQAHSADVIIKAAAVADYRPVQRSDSKLKKADGTKGLDLERTPDILSELGCQKKEQVLVGFAAETEELVANARKKMLAKNLDMIVANDVTQEGAGFDVETNIVKLLFVDQPVEELPQLSKDDVADVIVERVIQLLSSR